MADEVAVVYFRGLFWELCKIVEENHKTSGELLTSP
jgi:hypothetical protein